MMRLHRYIYQKQRNMYYDVERNQFILTDIVKYACRRPQDKHIPNI